MRKECFNPMLSSKCSVAFHEGEMALRNRNILVGAGLVCFGLCASSFPLLLTKMKKGNTIDTQEALNPTATMRGPYVNTGSRDIGPDPDYDVKTGTWRGRRNG